METWMKEALNKAKAERVKLQSWKNLMQTEMQIATKASKRF